MFLLFCFILQFAVILSQTNGNPAARQSCYDAFIKPTNGQIGGFKKQNLTFVTEDKIIAALKANEDKLDTTQKKLLNGSYIIDVYAQTFSPAVSPIYYVEIKPKNLIGAANQCVKFGGDEFKIDIAPYVTKVETTQSTGNVETTQAPGNPAARQSCYDAFIKPANGQIGGFKKQNLSFVTEDKIITALKANEDKLDTTQKKLLNGSYIIDVYAQTLSPAVSPIYYVEIKPKNLIGAANQCVKFGGDEFKIDIAPYVTKVETTQSTGQKCAVNQEWRSCNSACPAYCGSPKVQICNLMCRIGCGCRVGYRLRNKDSTECIKDEECPVTTQKVESTQTTEKRLSCYDSIIVPRNYQADWNKTTGNVTAVKRALEIVNKTKLDTYQKHLLDGFDLIETYVKKSETPIRYFIELKPKGLLGTKNICMAYDKDGYFNIDYPVSKSDLTTQAQTTIDATDQPVADSSSFKISFALTLVILIIHTLSCL